MARYAVDIEKFYLGEYWTNRYFVDATDLANAVSIGASIVTVERNIHKNFVQFTNYRASDVIIGTDIYTTTPINLFGLGGEPNEHLPLFAVVRVDFGVAGAGRPSRKYYRTPIVEGEQANGNLTANYVGSLVSSLSPLLSLPIVDPQGQLWNSLAPFPRVGMRQLRRGSKRKLLPIIV